MEFNVSLCMKQPLLSITDGRYRARRRVIRVRIWMRVGQYISCTLSLRRIRLTITMRISPDLFHRNRAIDSAANFLLCLNARTALQRAPQSCTATRASALSNQLNLSAVVYVPWWTWS
jgi:hypothetical protein